VILHWLTKVFPALQEQRELTMAYDETGGNWLSDLAASVLPAIRTSGLSRTSSSRSAGKRMGSLAPCCARAASGHAAALPRSRMNSRRFTASASRALKRKDSTPPHLGRLLHCEISTRPMSLVGQTRSFGDVGSMSGLPESGHGSAIYEYAP